MTKRELLIHLSEFGDEEEIWFYVKIGPGVRPEEIFSPVRSVVLTANGIVLRTTKTDKFDREIKPKSGG